MHLGFPYWDLPFPPSHLPSSFFLFSTLHSSHSLSQSHQNQLDSPCFNLIAGAWAQTQRPSSQVCSLHAGPCNKYPRGRQMARLTSGPLFLLFHPQMLCLPWEGVQASGSPVDQYPPSFQVCPSPPPPTVYHVSCWVVMEVIWKGAQRTQDFQTAE